MGLGRIKTRSGLETSHHQEPSRCKPIMKSVVLWVRDLVLFLVYALPGTPTTCRVYGLILARTFLYAIQGLVFYALALTITVGEQVKNPGVLVELTRLLLCHNTNNNNNNRNRRSTPNAWQSIVSDINQTYPELSDVLDDLIWTTENASTPDFTTSSTILSTMPTSSTVFSTMPTLENSTLSTVFSTMSTPLNNTGDTTTTTMAFPDPRTAEFQGYRLSWCLEVFSFKTGISTLTCSSSLMGPVCILAVVIMCSISVGFVCAAKPAAGKRTGDRV